MLTDIYDGQLLDNFFDNGGNFIDTANNYQEGQVRIWVITVIMDTKSCFI